MAKHVLPFTPATKIARILIGNEVLVTGDKMLIAHFVPAMKTLKYALNARNLTHIQVSTPHALAMLFVSNPPSAGQFRQGLDKVVLTPMIAFLRQTRTPFMINPYPYFGFGPKTLGWALFKRNSIEFDHISGKYYTNMFDAQIDAVYSALKRLGFGDVGLAVAETGWPSAGEAHQPTANLRNAGSYNRNLIRHIMSGEGTPLMPRRRFETYIFALFNENQKLGSLAERNFGLFRPDMAPVYNSDIMRDQVSSIFIIISSYLEAS
ncbi:hypothetical protein AMTR_s00012p00207850 [Amborella trichopoda]|uniref:Glucan endo-1,3-beta-D-glucosidase n=2 Tax=Amborella trichopoda TaxID=13333 RepID=W1PJL1_AMBTC|nr:hypothetical protein AMTR_s00012p00207850 [Amborella trichopoda]